MFQLSENAFKFSETPVFSSVFGISLCLLVQYTLVLSRPDKYVKDLPYRLS